MSDLIFMTGATGHVGFRALVLALKAGYTVRAAVRSQAKADTLTTHPEILALNLPSRLSTVLVPDMTVPGAYDDAVNGAKYIIHIASPLATGTLTTQDEYSTQLINPAVQGTLAILTAAQKVGSVEKIVITSSIAAVMDAAHFFGMESNDNILYKASDRIATPEGPFGNEFEAYLASKVRALNEAEAWVRREQPQFGLVHVMPSVIIGRDALVTSKAAAFNGTNATVLDVAVGKDSPFPWPGASVHSDDVAYVHVAALDPKIGGGESLFATWNKSAKGDGTRWQDVTEIVDRNFPEEVKKGLLSTEAKIGTTGMFFDAKPTEEKLGFRFKGFEEQVKSVVGHYLELVGQE